MNAKERTEWTKAVGACLPGGDIKAMLAAAEAADGPGRWEVSVCGAGLHAVGLRFFGAGDHGAWIKAALKAFALEGPGPDAPREGFPWLTAAWDLKTGRWTAVRLCGSARGAKLKAGRALAWDFTAGRETPTRRLLNPVPFKAGIFKEPVLDRALEDFSRLAPLASLSHEAPGWSLRLSQRLRWPMFARCELSAAFTPASSQLALFLLDRSVTELSFDGETLWAHCAG
ncbi:MAG: hypothetical protein PHS14_07920 [Elusimicrobia bacterium]|nr:hypothetical protein [Elusimicrobiota bacterium]